MKFVKVAIAAAITLAVSGMANAKPPLTAFGEEPAVRAAELSPDGSKVAFIARINDVDVLSIYDFTTQTTKRIVRIPDIHARSLQFVGDNHVILIASKTTRTFGYRGSYDFSAAFSLNLATGKIVQLLSRTPNLYPAQSGLGRIVGVDPDGQHVYMPAYMSSSEDPTKDLLRVDLDRGIGVTTGGGKSGNRNTIDWILNSAGKVIAREDFDSRARVHTIYAYPDGNARKIYSLQTPLPQISLHGVSEKTGELMVLDDQDTDFFSLLEMSKADGALSSPVARREDADIDGLVMDNNRVVDGVRYSGMRPSYQMFDPALNADLKSVVDQLPGSAVYVGSWTADWSKVLLYISGGAKPERYVILDRKAKTLTAIMNLRPEIKPEDVGEVFTVEYRARDDLKIPALFTWPAGVPVDQRKNLPLVVLPHGGPAAYDQIGFDWLAQFIANEGYAVLQPNFRGSSGFGASFTNAGVRQWGRKMQDDITDGVKAVSAMGWVDPARVCIVGWSYGGYAALAGGALTPELYKCVASIAGVSDLNEMLAYERGIHGATDSSVTYWKMVIGDPATDRDAIDAVSPARHADAFVAPVLLIHGTDDTTVPSNQSDRMNGALKGKGKPVTYLKINGDDHGLTENDSRRQVLTALGDFLAKFLKKAT